MTRFLGALAAVAALAFISNPVVAQTANGTAIVAEATPMAMKMPMAKMKPAGNHTCPKGSTYVKTYKKKDGTKVAGYCRKSTGKM